MRGFDASPIPLSLQLQLKCLAMEWMSKPLFCSNLYALHTNALDLNMACRNDMQMKALVCVSLSPSASFKVFEASEFGSHPLFSVAQGALDLQQVSIMLITDVRRATSLPLHHNGYFVSRNASMHGDRLCSPAMLHVACCKPDLLLSQRERLLKNSPFFPPFSLYIQFAHGFIPVSDWPNIMYTAWNVKSACKWLLAYIST